MKAAVRFRRAKVVCTIGPASRDEGTFRRLIEAGMDAVRINFSHTSHGDAARVVGLARDMARQTGRPLAVLADLQGPKIRIGELTAALAVVPGDLFVFVPEADPEAGPASAGREEPGSGDGRPRGRVIPSSYAALAEDVAAGDRILVDDGRVAFQVRSVEGARVTAEALTDGRLESHKGINLPGTDVKVAALTEKDREDLTLALDVGVDYVALSFVRRARDVEELRELVGDRALIIAKIEKLQAVRNLVEIMRASDGVMVARGDLGVELDFEEVPVVQKRILRLSRESTSIGITATQMLESMVTAPRPTRAEVSDVANALLDGTDAVMLSAETAVGEHPAEAVQAMCRVIQRIERERRFIEDASDIGPPRLRARSYHSVAGAIAGAAAEATERLKAPFLVTFTRSGFTARLMAAQRPEAPILAVTDEACTYHQLAMVWGTVPILHEGEVSYDAMLGRAKAFALEAGLGEEGQPFVVTAGVPFHVPGTTNYMRIETL